MTLDQAIANLIAEQNALDTPCATMNAAINAFEAQIEKIDEARATCDRIEAAANIKARADRHATMAAAETHAQPSLF
jgi:prefoldin subunit 5